MKTIIRYELITHSVATAFNEVVNSRIDAGYVPHMETQKIQDGRYYIQMVKYEDSDQKDKK